MSNINEQEMRSYLLGVLTPERHSELETLAQADENFREELLAIEEELVEQYLAKALTDDESRDFETRILNTERGKEKLHFAQLFARYRNSNPAEPVAVHSAPALNIPPNPTSSPLFATFYGNPTFAVLSIVVVGLLITLVGWLMVGPSRETSIADEVPSKNFHELVVTLAPDSTRSGTKVKHLTTPAKNIQIKLELEISKSDFHKYKTQLFRDKQAVESQDGLQTISKDNHYFIPVVFTGEILTPGEYQLKLCGVAESGQPSTVDNYSFRVTDDGQVDQNDRFAN